MNRVRRSLLVAILITVVVLSGLALPHVHAQDSSSGVRFINGSWKITNPTYIESRAEIVALLADIASEVKHDADIYSDPNGITVATTSGTTEQGKYSLSLPIQPRGPLFKLGSDAADKQGVGIYVITFADSFNGDELIQNVQLPQNNATTNWDDQRSRVSGGRILVWAPDAGEPFPTAFGDDGTLFTEDDPMGTVQPGWSLVDLDQKPFKIDRSDTVTADFIESTGGLEDYSSLSFADAWTKLFARVSTHYPFTEMKKLDFKAIHDTVQPMVDKAQALSDQAQSDAEKARANDAFVAAIQAFTLMFPDSHVGTSLPSIQSELSLLGEIGVGDMVLTDDGQVVVRYVTPKGPAERAGMKNMAVISQVDGKPVLDAVNAASTIREGASTPWFRQTLQLLTFLRGKVNSQVKLTFQNPNEDAKTVQIRRRQANQYDVDIAPQQIGDPLELVVSAKILPSGFGYISLRNFFEDRPLEYRLFVRDLQRLIDAQVPGIIIDVRDDPGGFSDMGTSLAGHFYQDKTLIYTSQSVNDKGEFIKRYTEYIEPKQPNYSGPVAVLVDTNTVSEGEYFAYFMKHSPNAVIVGSSATSGGGGGIQEYKLPAGIDHWQAPEYPSVDDQGNIIIEGTGVEPDVKVPVTVDSVRSGDDTVLKAAEDKLSQGAK